MKTPSNSRPTRRGQRLLTLLMLAATPQALAGTGPAVDPKHPIYKDNANPRLLQHSNFFVTQPTGSEPSGPTVYHLRKQHWPLAQYPDGLQYEAYSAVGYDLANSILLVGPSKTVNGKTQPGEWIIVDTLGSGESAKAAIKAFKAKLYGTDTTKWPTRIPLRAVIYTHNHIDHTAGVLGFLAEADKPACASDYSGTASDDYFNVDTSASSNGKPCVAVLGQANITNAIVNTSTIVGSIIDPRSGYMYGNLVPFAHVNSGIGPQEGTTRLQTGNSTEKGTAPQASQAQAEAAKATDPSAYYMPSRLFSKKLNITAAGLNLQLIYAPSETNDEIIAFLPDRYNGKGAAPKGNEKDWSDGQGLLLSAEVIQGPSFPNLYSLRGTSFRDPADWYTSVDTLRALNSWCMLPAHGPPLCDHDNIELLLRSFRDAIQFANDQAIRYINKGYTMEELPQLIKLPSYLLTDLDKLKPIQNEGATSATGAWVNPEDYLTEFYGSVSQGVREIYAGKVGFFQADPVQLRPTESHVAARQWVELMNGADTVLNKAEAILKDATAMKPIDSAERIAKLQWAAELASLAIKAGIADPNYPTDFKSTDTCKSVGAPFIPKAKSIKSKAFAQLAQVEINPNWRNWYAASSRELDCALIQSQIVGGLVSPTIITALPANYWIQQLGWRLKAEETVKGNVNQSLAFYITNEPGAGKDSKTEGPAGYVLTVRKAVAQFNETGGTEDAVKKVSNVVLSMNRAAFNKIVRTEGDGKGDLKQVLADMLKSKEIVLLKGTQADASTFMGWFDPKPIAIPVLSGR